MKSAYRFFASLLAVLFILVGISLGGSWYLRHVLNPVPGVVAARSSGAGSPAESIQTIRFWTTVSQAGSLILCGILCGFGLHIRRRAGREAQAKEEAERALDRERRALEKRVEDRTRELRQEVEERRRAEELNRGQKQVLEMLASPEAQPTEEILRHLTATIASQRRSWECALHLLDGDGKTLRLVASSEVSDRLEHYLATIARDFPDAPESKACTLGEMYIVEKMTDVRRPWSEFLVANGILSAWSVPIQRDASGAYGGTFTVYTRLQSTPSPRDLEMIETAAKLAALVIDHRRIHAELVHNAYQDPLTGLPNRRAGEESIQDALEQASKAGESFALLWIDLDRFKRINDQHGHSAGDYVLRRVADRIRSHPHVAGMAARMGGDEFLVLLVRKDVIDTAPQIAQDLLSSIAEPITYGGATLAVTASIGISVFPRDGNAMDLLERNADAAMYRAKAAGTGSCIYSPAMSAEMQQSLEIEEALDAAIEREYLHVAFQPVYTSAGSLVGFEALLRFRHPTLGNVPPSRFIPIAEETRRIIPIGNWVLREACRQLRTWHAAGLPWVRMAVNISAIQFVRDDFADVVAAVLAEFNIPPMFLTLELTESVVMEDYRSVVRQMTLLKVLGVRIAMDDFGTGYSSLSYLHKLPIDILKIDRSFMERLPEPDGTRPIVEAIISMGRHLGLTIVAEGVETALQHMILKEAGCDAVQGYLFARPMGSQDAEKCLRSGVAAVLTEVITPPQPGCALAN